MICRVQSSTSRMTRPYFDKSERSHRVAFFLPTFSNFFWPSTMLQGGIARGCFLGFTSSLITHDVIEERTLPKVQCLVKHSCSNEALLGRHSILSPRLTCREMGLLVWLRFAFSTSRLHRRCSSTRWSSPWNARSPSSQVRCSIRL